MACDTFLKIDGIPGESTDEKHAGEIEILSFSWSANSNGSIGSSTTGGGVGKAVFSDFSFQKKVDLASPKLALIAANGGHIATATYSIRKAGGAAGQVDYQTYDFEKLYVTGISVSVGSDGDCYETLTLSPTKFKWKYSQQDDKGALSGNAVVTVDRSKNTAV